MDFYLLKQFIKMTAGDTIMGMPVRIDVELYEQAKARAQAERRALALIDEAKVSAKAEGDRIAAAARADLEGEVQRARAALRDQVASLAIASAEKILRREVDAKAHADLLAQLKQELS